MGFFRLGLYIRENLAPIIFHNGPLGGTGVLINYPMGSRREDVGRPRPKCRWSRAVRLSIRAAPVEILTTWTPKVCKIMAFWAIIRGLGLLFYILLGFRYSVLPGVVLFLLTTPFIQNPPRSLLASGLTLIAPKLFALCGLTGLTDGLNNRTDFPLLPLSHLLL